MLMSTEVVRACVVRKRKGRCFLKKVVLLLSTKGRLI